VTLTALRWRYLVLSGLRWLPVGMWIPVLVLVPLGRGLDILDVGVLFAVHGITVAVLELPTGGWADAIGRRPVALLASALSLIGMVGWVVADGMAGFLVAELAVAVGRALDSGPMDAWFIDEARLVDDGHDPEPDLARVSVVVNAALATGALLAGLVGLTHDAASVGAASSIGGARWGRLLGQDLVALDVPLLTAVLAGALHLTALFVLMRETPKGRGRAAGDHEATAHRVVAAQASGRIGVAGLATVAAVRRGVALVRGSRALQAIIIAEALWGVSLASVELLWQPRLAELAPAAAARPLVPALLVAAGFGAGAAGAALAPVIRRATATTGGAAAFSRVGQAIALILLAAVTGPLGLAGAYVMVYAGNGASGPPHLTLLHRPVAAAERATVLSVHSLGGQVGGTVGSLGLAAVAGASSMSVAWLVAAVVLAATAALYPYAERHA